MNLNRYKNSEEWLRRAELTIPLGSQTFSKSRTQYPIGISPFYIDRSKGCITWDIDGNRYIDLVSSLASVTLGYNHKQINSAVKRQLKMGVISSLPGKLEAEVSELICSLVPSAEMVRFGKNGTDATSAAVRLARAYTGRDHIAVCGYHGWQDWYIGSTTRDKGVPEAVRNLTHKFEFNNIASFMEVINSHDDLACVILEPMNNQFPVSGFLEKIREVTREKGIVLIFDETITGFRMSKGGAQEYFQVIPDLSTFGKGLANGFPLSAVVGKREIMMEMEEIFFSGTFGGELLSLAAAREVLKMHAEDAVSPELGRIGKELSSKTKLAIDQEGMGKYLSLSGHDTWRFLNWSDSETATALQLKTYFLQEIFRQGVLVLSTHNVNLALTPKYISKISQCYSEVFSNISQSIRKGDIVDRLLVSPPLPLFSVR